jgi:ABC-2 type transport system ATP-binding protein
MADAVRVEGVTRRFGALRALDGLTFRVPVGSVFGFLGPNGAGKSTTIALLLGLLAADEGRVEVLGMDPITSGDEVRRRCGVLLADVGLYNNLTVAENLEFHGRCFGLAADVRQSRAADLLSSRGLWERRDDVVGTWSTGMRRRLGVVRALLAEPELLFLDEPTAGLDVLAAREVRDDLAATAATTGATVFLTTHNMVEAEQLCDTVAVLQHGRVIAVGTPSELVAGPASVVRVRGAGFAGGLRGRLGAVDGVDVLEASDTALSVQLAPGMTAGGVVEMLVAGGATVDEVVHDSRSLEEAFVELLQREA